jgi:hypothetical protein
MKTGLLKKAAIFTAVSLGLVVHSVEAKVMHCGLVKKAGENHFEFIAGSQTEINTEKYEPVFIKSDLVVVSAVIYPQEDSKHSLVLVKNENDMVSVALANSMTESGLLDFASGSGVTCSSAK